LEELTIDLGVTTITPEALKELNKLLAARELPVIGSLVGDFEDFFQRMKQGAGPLSRRLKGPSNPLFQRLQPHEDAVPLRGMRTSHANHSSSTWCR
jgi:hypothetical protein